MSVQQESSSSSESRIVPAPDPSSPEAQTMAPATGKACCSCTCAVSENRYAYTVVPDAPNERSNSKVKIRAVARAEAPSFTSCVCYYEDKHYTWTQVPAPDPSGSKSLRFVFRRVPVSASSEQTRCHCFVSDERYTVTKVQVSKSASGLVLGLKRVPKPNFAPRVCCSCLCSYCCLCCYAGTQYENPGSQLPANASDEARCSTSSAFRSFSSVDGAARPGTQPLPPPKGRGLHSQPREKTSSSTSRLHKSSLPVKRRLGSQLAAHSRAEQMPLAKRPRISENSGENSARLPEKTKMASQVGAVFHKTKPILAPKCQELKWNPKEKSSLSASNTLESSSRQQTSSLSGKRVMEKEVSSHAGPEPMPPTKRPRISVNSSDGSSFGASVFPENKKIAGQVSGAIPQTKPTPPLKRQESQLNPKETLESSSRKQTPSSFAESKKAKTFGSECPPEPGQIKKAPKLKFHRDEKWVKNLRKILKERKVHGRR